MMDPTSPSSPPTQNQPQPSPHPQNSQKEVLANVGNTATDPDLVKLRCNPTWVELKDKKSFSRLLYTNPVCFLTTTADVTCENTCADVASSVGSRILPRRNVMVVSWLTPTNNNGRFMMSINKRRHTATILTSLFGRSCVVNESNRENGGKEKYDSSATVARSTTATSSSSNNSSCQFVLCVPVSGMEQLVLDVGRTSGRWGRSKFPQDNHNSSSHENCTNTGSNTKSSGIASQANSMNSSNDRDRNTNQVNSKHEVKKQTKNRKKKTFEFMDGIEGLLAVKVGTSACTLDLDCCSISNNTGDSSSTDRINDNINDKGRGDTNCNDLFAIKGTVAHLKCTINDIPSLQNENMIDDEHHLILAEIYEAHVRSDYWDGRKKRFVPQHQSPTTKMKNHDDKATSSTTTTTTTTTTTDTTSTPSSPPYLTFFGSQTFGYISTRS